MMKLLSCLICVFLLDHSIHFMDIGLFRTICLCTRDVPDLACLLVCNPALLTLHSGWVKNVEVFDEGKLISTAFDGTIRLWVSPLTWSFFLSPHLRSSNKDIGGDYPENRDPNNVLLQHNGIARITYLRGGTGSFASSSRLIVSLTRGCIAVFSNLDISTPEQQEVSFCSQHSFPLSGLRKAITLLQELLNTDISDLSDFLEGGTAMSSSDELFDEASRTASFSNQLSSSPTSDALQGRHEFDSFPFSFASTSLPPTSSPLSSVVLPRPFLRKKNRVEILWEVLFSFSPKCQRFSISSHLIKLAS